MPDSKVQFTSHHPGATDDRPFLIQFPTSQHTSCKELTTQIAPSVKDYHQPQQQQQHQQHHHHHHHHHNNSPIGLNYHHHSHQQLDIFNDPNFQVSATHGHGHGPALLPMPPVAYEDFRYPLPNLDLPPAPDQQVASSVIRSTGLQQQQQQSNNNNTGFIYHNTYPTNGTGSYGHNNAGQLPLMSTNNHWNMATPINLPGQDLLLPNFLNEYEPSSRLHSNNPSEPGPHHQSSDAPPPPNLTDNAQINYPPLPNPPTPPPLFDATEQDLLSSFLNIFGDSHGECDFDPQGMPEGMPVLGELKRRLEEEGLVGPLQYCSAKRDADDVGRQVEARLKISDPDSVYPRRPSLQSFHTTSGSLSSSSDSHFYQDQNFASRKKAKTTNLINSFDAHPSHFVEPPHGHCVDLEGDTKMSSWECHPTCEAGDWTGTTVSHPLDGSHPSQFSKPFKPSFSQSAPLSPVSQPNRSFQRVKNNSVTSFEAEGSHTVPLLDEGLENQTPTTTTTTTRSTTTSRRGSKRGTKAPKSTHIVSEQRRRNAIQGGFGSLVEILRAGEAVSGISIAVGGETSSSNSHHVENHHQNNVKPKTRGRGRRGEIETGASKSVVLEKAAEFVQWLADGNLALKNEVVRIENLLRNHGLQV